MGILVNLYIAMQYLNGQKEEINNSKIQATLLEDIDAIHRIYEASKNENLPEQPNNHF